VIYVKKSINPSTDSMRPSSRRSPSPLHFFLCAPGKFITHITARPCDTSVLLSSLFPDQPMVFLFKGMILTPTVTFSDFGIRTNDTVVGLPDRRVLLGEVREWVKATKDGDALDEMIRSVMSVSTRPELMRLRDLAWSRAEMRPKQMRRAMRRHEDSDPPMPVVDAGAKSVIGEVPTELSTAELPQLW
jgi:hypothetical protein